MTSEQDQREDDAGPVDAVRGCGSSQAARFFATERT